jgi:predicted nucleic acid-binding protein
VRLVLDASAAIEVVMDRGKSRRFAHELAAADFVLSPDLFVAEITNTIWKYYRFEHLEVKLCDEAIEESLALVDVFVSCKELYREAFLLARTTGKTAYDTFYLALARREDATLLTADGALRKEAERQGIRVD